MTRFAWDRYEKDFDPDIADPRSLQVLCRLIAERRYLLQLRGSTRLAPDEMSLCGLPTLEAIWALQRRLVHCAETNQTRLLVETHCQDMQSVVEMCNRFGFKCAPDPVRPVVGIDFARSPDPKMVGFEGARGVCGFDANAIDWTV